MQFVDCSGSPREMGRQYGEQARAGIRHNIEKFITPFLAEPAGRVAAIIRRRLGNTAPKILTELEGIAEGSGISLDYLLLYNHVDTFGKEWRDECTPMALAGGRDGPIIAKNNDAPLEEDSAFVVRRSRPDKGYPLLQVIHAGLLNGMDAMNAVGLGNTHGSVGSVYDKSGWRLDIRLWTYHLMRNCRTTKEFLAGLLDVPLTGKGFNIAVVDQSGDTAIIEAAIPLMAVRDRGKRIVYATNHFNLPNLKSADMRTPRAKEISIYRYGYLEWQEQTAPPENAEDIKRLLSGHLPWAPCRHGGPHGSKTVWSMIGLARHGKILVSFGAPCTNEYNCYEIGP